MIGMTVDDVLDGIMDSLGEKYPGTTMAVGEAKEDYPKPLFAVKLMSVANNREMGRRYQLIHQFKIEYMTLVPTYKGLHDTANHLYTILENIAVAGNLIQGRGMRHEIINGVLHFYVHFNFHALSVVTRGAG
ncbi:hypothetical protein K0T92_21250 [Paenibacillus oenotherae]|uniref:Uncharacterized protein n=1 Tax=Paenibacillus oenotherae TaxID=1435645 RepID=A0ABS7DDJ2_9BACL|nr:hypothetical protein [Paenibacillus oenotherae]MBW7477248.1 hypothetical protein [Paenibacillus oenotherae]